MMSKEKIDYTKWSKLDLVIKIQERDDQIKKNQDMSNQIKQMKKRKKYGLVWDEERTKEVFEEEVCEKLPILKDVTKNGIDDNSKPNNILIEGDNYHALSVLNYTHKGKIDVIYIDPPYNTGNNDFKFNDKYIDIEDTYRHSKWLSFMSKRLRLAKKLLTNSGVIFISIDDNEQAQLRILCDEIFGVDNFITNIIWQSKTGSSDAKTIDTVTEYILVYAKKKNNANFLKNMGAHKVERFRHEDEYLESRGKYYLDTLDRGGLRYSDSLNFPITCPDGSKSYPNGRSQFTRDGWTWKWGKKKVEWGIKNKFISFKKSKTKKSGWTIQYKNYLFADNKGEVIKRSLPYKNVITNIKTGDGAKTIKELFGSQVFKYTKPTELVISIIKMIQMPSNGIILDFMAGTGTTGQAVLELNKEDGGNRKFILCTNNENNICTDICYPRLKKVIKGYKFKGKMRRILFEKEISYNTIKSGEQISCDLEQIKDKNKNDYDKFEVKIDEGNIQLIGIKQINDEKSGLGGNLKYFKTQFIDWKSGTDHNKKILAERSTEMLCLKEDCFELVSEGKEFKIFKNYDNKYLGIIYYYDGIEPFKKEILKLKKKINTYVFSFSNKVNEDEFKDMSSLVTLKPIPSAILNVYKRIFGCVQI